MCLIVNRFYHWTNKPMIAKRDIKCCKVLCVNFNDRLVTPFHEKRIDFCDATNGLKSNTFDYHWKIVRGAKTIHHGIHTFKSHNIAIKNMQSCNFIFVVGFIPKGTKYWVGKDGDYCSEMIKFN